MTFYRVRECRRSDDGHYDEDSDPVGPPYYTVDLKIPHGPFTFQPGAHPGLPPGPMGKTWGQMEDEKMNKVHHTPGPWNLKAGSALTITSSAGDIAYLCDCRGAETRPNAILIAAAPTLLEAAREALRMVRNCPGNWENGVREMLERAIAIATEVR